MTSYFAFTPSRRAAPTFAPTLDGGQYTCVCTWNLSAQRYYVNCYDQNGVLIFALPIVETPPALALNSLSWNGLTGLVTVTTQSPHGYPIGSVVNLTVSGCAPTTYNGAFLVNATGASTFTYPLSANPGSNTVVGSASFLIDLAGGYFASTLVYRNGNFEVSP